MIAITKEEFCSKILEYEAAMYHTAYAIPKNDADCADAMQDAILKAYKNIGTLKKTEYFKTWLIRILINTCYSLIRSRKYTEDLESTVSAGIAAEDDFSKSELMMEISALDEKYRIPFMLYYIDGFSAEEIARIVSLPSATVRKRLSRARQILRSNLSGETF